MGFPPVPWPLVWGFGFTATMVAVMIVIYYYNEIYRVKNGTGTKNYRSCSLSSSTLEPTMDHSEETAFPDAHGYLKNCQVVMSDDDEDDTRSNTSGRSNIRPSSPSNVVVLLLDRWRRKSQRRTSQCAIYHRQSASALVKVPDKLSEVLGDVLELACGGSTGSADKAGSGATNSAASRIGMVTGVAIIRGRWAQRTSRSPLSSVTTTDSTDSTTSSEQEFNALAKEQHLAVQPSSAMEGTIVGESADSEYGIGTSLAQPRMTMTGGNVHSMSGCRSFVRNASISSQGSLEGGGSSSSGAHRGSCSPRIRAFGPDGRHRQPESFPTASSYPPSRSSRSPSPARAVSLDARSGSPASFAGSGGCGTASPSQSSLSSLTTGGASSSCGSSSMGAARSVARCLSPLLIPPPTSSITSDVAGPAPPASPLGSLQPDLYQRRDGPLFLSAQTTTAGKNMGRLHLRLKYDFDRSDLRVHLIEAHDLAGTDQGGFNDPYVKLTLSPEVDTRKRQTSIHRNNPNPFFDQHFKFPVSHEQLQEKTLVLQVFDYDRFSRNDVVGSVRVAMEQLEFVSSTSSIEVWGEIAREKKPPEEIQQVLLSLSYLPSAERLTVLILKARNLFPSQEDKEIVDPFVKVSLLTGDKRVKKKKTAVRKATRCPVWNEAMSFNVSAGLLASSAIEVCVLDSSSELIGGNAILGSCIVGPATGGTAVETEAGVSNQSREHWLHMTHSPRKAIAMWHTLH